MKREEDWLREACTQLAQEETERWERGLTPAELLKADEAYRRHRRRALSLIRRSTRKQSPARIILRAAAVLLVLAGAAYLSLRRPPRDTVPQTRLSAATAAPYYSPVPTFSPNPVTEWAYIPTPTPYSSEIRTEVPTYTPIPEDTPAISPTSPPTPEPTPTPLPTPEPTSVPTAEPTPALTAVPSPPEGWTGSLFPMGLLDAAAPDISRGDGWQQVAWDGWEFAEYADERVLDVPEDAGISYVQWADTVALRAETAEGVTLIWVQDGHSLRLFTTVEEGAEMAKTVKKVSGE